MAKKSQLYTKNRKSHKQVLSIADLNPEAKDVLKLCEQILGKIDKIDSREKYMQLMMELSRKMSEFEDTNPRMRLILYGIVDAMAPPLNQAHFDKFEESN